jgi:hypothetical protein
MKVAGALLLLANLAKAQACTNHYDCLNGGTCVGLDKGGDFTHSNGGPSKYCTCLGGFTGASCGLFCPIKCSNGGTCENKPYMHSQAAFESDYTCTCLDGWKGVACDIQYTECPDGLECLNNAICRLFDDNEAPAETYRCECPFTHQGYNCEVPVDIETCPDNSKCLNGGKCVPSDDNDEFQLQVTYQCNCPNSHEGVFCEDRKIGANQIRSEASSGGVSTTAIGLISFVAIVATFVCVVYIVFLVKNNPDSGVAKTEDVHVGVGQIEADGSATMKNVEMMNGKTPGLDESLNESLNEEAEII